MTARQMQVTPYPDIEAMTFIDKLIRGHRLRKTRFHDEMGNLLDATGWVFVPHAVVTSVLKRLGYGLKVPWISYRARRVIRAMMRPDWRVVEFGSGVSTLWFAEHCGFVHSIESDPAWFGKISNRLLNRKNIRYEQRSLDRYANLDDHSDGSLDFCLIDGAVRAECVQSALPKMKRGGIIYLDNSDKEITMPTEIPIAKQLLSEAARRCHGEIKLFVDFVPTNSTATQGMMVRL
jgi:predicted O-methyltransferase YrrM